MHKDFRADKMQEQNERKNSLWMIVKTHYSKAHAMLVKIGLILSVPMKYMAKLFVTLLKMKPK